VGFRGRGLTNRQATGGTGPGWAGKMGPTPPREVSTWTAWRYAYATLRVCLVLWDHPARESPHGDENSGWRYRVTGSQGDGGRPRMKVDYSGNRSGPSAFFQPKQVRFPRPRWVSR
jgi:hypothetical protein